MSWENDMTLVTANKLFEEYGILIAQDLNTKIYEATLGDKKIQNTSVMGITKTILKEWFTISTNKICVAEQPKRRCAPLFGSDREVITISDNFDEPLEDFQDYM